MVIARRRQDDAVADADVLGPRGAGGEEDLGRRGMRVLLEEVMLDLPDMVDAEAVGQFDLGQRILEELVLAAAVPRARKLVLVEESETHGLSPKSVVPTEAERSEAQWRDLFF